MILSNASYRQYHIMSLLLQMYIWSGCDLNGFMRCMPWKTILLVSMSSPLYKQAATTRDRLSEWLSRLISRKNGVISISVRKLLINGSSTIVQLLHIPSPTFLRQYDQINLLFDYCMIQVAALYTKETCLKGERWTTLAEASSKGATATMDCCLCATMWGCSIVKSRDELVPLCHRCPKSHLVQLHLCLLGYLASGWWRWTRGYYDRCCQGDIWVARVTLWHVIFRWGGRRWWGSSAWWWSCRNKNGSWSCDCDWYGYGYWSWWSTTPGLLGRNSWPHWLVIYGCSIFLRVWRSWPLATAWLRSFGWWPK